MAWNRSTIIKLLVGVFLAFVILLAAGIWFVVRSEELAPARREAGDWAILVFTSAAEAQRQLDVELEKIKAAGEPLTIEEIVPPEVPDAENAAMLYQQAFDKLSISEADKKALSDLLNSMGESPKAKAPPLATLEQIVASNAEAIKLLEAAAQRPKCWFPVNWEAGYDAKFPHYARLRTCARLLSAKIAVHARRGQMQEALDTTRVSLEIGEAIRDEPTLLGQLVRYVIVPITLPPLRTGLSNQATPTAACEQLFAYLQAIEFRESFVRTFWGERAMGRWWFNHLREHPKAGTFITSEDTPELGRLYATPRGQKILDLDETVYLRLMSETIALVARSWREVVEAQELLERRIETVPRYSMITVFLMPIYSRTLLKRDETIARVGLAQAALALKAYKNKKGSYPASLDELREVILWKLRVDPFSGEDFIYEHEGEGFLVYSIGPNLKDDSGQPLNYEKQVNGVTPGDIIWRCDK